MTYLDLIRDADRKLDKGHITLGEYEQMIEPMNREIHPEIIRCKDCKYRYLDGMIWNCPFGLSGGEDFFCAYGAIDGGSGT